MSQITLRLRKKLIYSPENFFWYQDIKLLKQDIGNFDDQISSSYLVTGKESSGKTHLALSLLELSRKNNLVTELIVSLKEFETIIAKNYLPKIIFFDAFEKVLKGKLSQQDLESKLIHCFDFCKSKQIKLIVFTEKLPNFESTPLSSRFRELVQIKIGKLSIQEQQGMLEVIARQRGYKLSQALIEYISKRVTREVSEIIDFFNRLEYVQAESNLKVNRELIAKVI